MEELTLLQQSSLEKVFLDAGEFKPPYLKASVLQGEEFAYQLVLKKTEWGRADFSFFLDSPLKEHIQLFEVESSPVRWRHIPGREDTTATISPCMPDCFPTFSVRLREIR